jgi:hypothetical protein
MLCLVSEYFCRPQCYLLASDLALVQYANIWSWQDVHSNAYYFSVNVGSVCVTWLVEENNTRMMILAAT